MRYSSKGVAIAICLAFVVGCGRSGEKQGTQTGTASTPEPFQADELAAVNSDKFLAPIVLQVPADAFTQAQQLEALGGSDPRQTNGAAYERSDFFPCAANAMPEFVPLFVEVPTPNGQVFNWMGRQNFLRVQTYTIQYPNAQMPEYGTTNTFNCAVVQDGIVQYLPIQARANLHSGFRVAVGGRIFSGWTFENRYETPVPGKGNVKVFAATMSYKIRPLLPHLAFSGEGSASVKVSMNPDNGLWEVESLEMHDPALMLDGEVPVPR